MKKLLVFFSVIIGAYAQTGGWVVPGGGGLRLVLSNPAGNACAAASVVNFGGTLYTCQSGIFAIMPSSGSAGVATVNGRAGAVTITSGDVTAALPAFSGDVTSPAGSPVLTLPNINTAVGACGDSTHTPVSTYNAKGQVTGCTPVLITGTGGAAIGAPVGSGTSTSLLFVDPSGFLAQNPALISWNNATQTFQTNGVHINNFSGGAAAWIDLPTVGPSGIGTDGPGVNVLAGVVAANDQYFTGALPHDFVYRAPFGHRMLFGVSGNGSPTVASIAMSSNNAAFNIPIELLGGNSLIFDGITSGNIAVQSPAVVTTPYTLVLPATPGTNGQVLSTDGLGNTSWATGSGGGGGATSSSQLSDFAVTVSGQTINVAAGAYRVGNTTFAVGATSFTATSYTVTTCTNTTPIVCTFSSTAGIHSGDTVMISGVGGTTNANNTWTVTQSGLTLTLNGSVGNGAYTSGGIVTGTGTGVVKIEGNDAGEIVAYSASSAGLVMACTGTCLVNQQASPTLDADANPIGTITVTGGVIGASVDMRAFMSSRGVTAGDGIAVSDIGGIAQVAVDSTVMRTGGVNTVTGTIDASNAITLPYQVGTGTPAGHNCTVGQVYYQSDATARSNTWGCTTSGTPGTWTLQGASGGSSGGLVTTGVGQFWLTGYAPGTSMTGSIAASFLASSANLVVVYVIETPVSFAISHATFNISTVDSGQTGDYGIYTTAGTRLWHYGSGAGFSFTSGGVVTASNTQVTIPAGTYYLAVTQSGTLGKISATTTTTSINTIWNTNFARYGTAANAATAGILPSTLGTITPSIAALNFPAILLEP